MLFVERLRAWGLMAAVVLAGLAGCGGGGGSAPLPSPERAVSSSVLRALPVRDAQRAAPVGAFDANALMDWAEKAYPTYFAPASQPTQSSSPYSFRYYPATQNYLGVAGQNVYVMGPLTAGVLAKVGALTDFACQAQPANCGVPGAPSLQGATAGDGNVSLAFSAPASTSPIVRYTAVCSAGFDIHTGISTTSPVVVSGLTNGTPYQCTVSATNAAGTGAASDPTAVIPQSGGSGSVPSGSATFVTLVSDFGDYVGGGETHTYTLANSIIQFDASGNRLSVHISADAWWDGNFQLPSTAAELKVGQYTGLTRYPFNAVAKGGLDWSGDGRGCNTLTGTITIDSVSYIDGVLDSIRLHFEQHCEGASPALRGTLQYSAHDPTTPPGPVTPVPPGLWSAPASAIPATGNYVYLASDSGDYIGGGATHLYTQANAILNGSVSGGHLQLNVGGDENWTGDFVAMNSISSWQPGYYGDLMRYPFHNPVKGGLSWSGEGRGCNTLTGWFAIDDIAFSGGGISRVQMRFEQHCEGGGPALHGAIRWSADDTTSPPGPVNPPPANLWAPPAGVVPASGSFVYLQSDAGDYIGGGATTLYTSANTSFAESSSGAHVFVSVGGWTGDFVGMSSLQQLQPGYYAGLERYPFNNVVKGGLDWSGQGRGCNTLSGWFVVDDVVYAAGQIASFTLRFEQHCEGMAAALHGMVRFTP